ncbi:PilZ domain protein [Marinomonas gallaica]|uniref:PilZ domain protein n=1 Tax=Marinomonas gallaica TaxID=1806667 RepID=A0A1C3JV24_9GAMM|nr:PilZ domain-containing protein [Marinomonas gallaica]SBT19043.1 PilZ domain protein [Marinomonas gallaica]SBT21998.1 PilZ domain protein [Marinomonas gallaica]
MSGDQNFEYQSSERRNAVRVIPKDHTLTFDQGKYKFGCIDISMDGVALASDLDLAIQEGEQVAFILDENDRIIGQVKAKLIYKKPDRSGWAFTAIEDQVSEFIDELVLETQKSALRAAASTRRIEQEKAILDEDDE